MKQFSILTGLSGAGKSPLQRAVRRLVNPDPTARRPVLITSRNTRPNETPGVDYWYLPKSFIESLHGNPDFAVVPVRSDLQALHLPSFRQMLDEGTLFMEGYHLWARKMMEEAVKRRFGCTTIHLSYVPAGTDETMLKTAVRKALEKRGRRPGRQNSRAGRVSTRGSSLCRVVHPPHRACSD